MSARITTTHSMQGGGSGPSVAEIKQFIAGLPDDATLALKTFAGNQMDPGSWTITTNAVPVRPYTAVR